MPKEKITNPSLLDGPPKDRPYLKATILGCGSSGGVPRIMGDWGACDPNNPKNRRRRCALGIELVNPSPIKNQTPIKSQTQAKSPQIIEKPPASQDAPSALNSVRVAIDTSPDFHGQMLDLAWPRLDGVFYTHDHADQAHGLDDVRGFFLNQGAKTPLPAFADKDSAARLMQRFAYCFEGKYGYPPIMGLNIIDKPVAVKDWLSRADQMPPEIQNCLFTPLFVHHGAVMALGYRFDIKNRATGKPLSLAYMPDVSAIPTATMKQMEGLDYLILDALRYLPHPTHIHLEAALAIISQLAPKQAVLTNLHTHLDYQSLYDSLPDHIRPAYDGLSLYL